MLEFLNSDVCKLFVVLLAIVAIIKLFLSAKCNADSKTLKIHICYISGICVFIIIELTTYICVHHGYQSDIVDYVSFASTLSSLLLSVVAIIYAIVSNNKGDVQYKKIDSASDRISSSVDKFSQTSQNLSAKIDSIITRLEELKTISTETKSAINNNNQTNIEKSAESNLSEQSTTIDRDNLIDSYIKQGSFSGNLAILACVYAYEQGKILPLEQLFGKNALYCCGYIIATSVLGIISTHLSGDVVVVHNAPFNIKSKLIECVENYINNTQENTDAKELYQNVKDFFGITEDDEAK